MIQDRIEKIKSEFLSFSDWESRYKHLIEMGKSLPAMQDSFKVEANKIKGCQSQVWLMAELKDGSIYFSADSDASIVKGIVALLVFIYSGSSPDEILNTKATFLEDIGLKEHLSMSRANGLTSMLKQITFYAMAYKAQMQLTKN
jgi:cysteine desulfuration protein SufE